MTDQHEECLQFALSQVSLAKAYEPRPPADVGSSGDPTMTISSEAVNLKKR